MMDINHMGNWNMGFGWVIMIAFWVIIILGMLYIVKNNARSTTKLSDESAEEILKKRYASGNISEQEYKKILNEIHK